MSEREYATMSYLANFPGPLPNLNLAHGMYEEPIHHVVSPADAVASHYLSNYPNYRVSEGYEEGFDEGYNEDYGGWTSSISQVPDHVRAATGGQPPPIGPITPPIAGNPGHWTDDQKAQVTAALGPLVLQSVAQALPQTWTKTTATAFLPVMGADVTKFVFCLAQVLETLYHFQSVMGSLQGAAGLSAYEGNVIKCGYNALYKKINLTSTVYQNLKSQTVPKDTTQAKKFLACLNEKTLSFASKTLSGGDRLTAYECEQSVGVDAGVGPPPLVPLKPGKPVGPPPLVPLKPGKPVGSSQVPWYTSPLVWSLIVLGVFLLVIIIIIIVTSVQNNKKVAPLSFSWSNSRAW
jgi:hypothetical protein